MLFLFEVNYICGWKLGVRAMCLNSAETYLPQLIHPENQTVQRYDMKNRVHSFHEEQSL